MGEWTAERVAVIAATRRIGRSIAMRLVSYRAAASTYGHCKAGLEKTPDEFRLKAHTRQVDLAIVGVIVLLVPDAGRIPDCADRLINNTSGFCTVAAEAGWSAFAEAAVITTAGARQGRHTFAVSALPAFRATVRKPPQRPTQSGRPL